MNRILFEPKKERKTLKAVGKWLAVTIAIILFLFLSSWPLRNWQYKKYITQADQLLADRKYVSAYVVYEKAGILMPTRNEPEGRQSLAISASRNINDLRNFLTEKNRSDDIKLLEKLDGDCDLAEDRQLVEADKSQFTITNLGKCLVSEPRNINVNITLGVANLKIAQSTEIFKQYRDEFYSASKSAFLLAYDKDPLNKDVVNYLLQISKSQKDQPEVEHWQKMLDNLK